VVVIVTFPKASMLSRLVTLSTALFFVGLQTLSEQLMFLVAPEDIVTLASAFGATSATDMITLSAPTPAMLRKSFNIEDMWFSAR
jgi:hypothetical protein